MRGFFGRSKKMMTRVAIFVLLASVFWPSSLFAQSTPPALPSSSVQSATANGVLGLAIQPAATAPQGATPLSSLLWLYDTNAKTLILCSSHIDGGFSCTPGVKLAW
jgi:hypothetical protein